jgi:hypothetical protein
MKTKSTYSLLVRSEEKGRSIFEMAVYGMLVLSSFASVLQFASAPMALPTNLAVHAPVNAIVVAAAPQLAVDARG